MKRINAKILIAFSCFLSTSAMGDASLFAYPKQENLAIANYKPRKKPIVVAVIDTGLSSKIDATNFKCKSGHRDFTGTNINDSHGHGSHISGLIHQYVTGYVVDNNQASEKELTQAKAPYCQVILKYYDPNALHKNNLLNEILAIKYAIAIKVDIINISGGGTTESLEEKLLIQKAIDQGIRVVVAAGNEGKNLSKQPYYPAMSNSEIVVVGNITRNLTRASTSNYGNQVDSWEFGVSRLSFGVDGKFVKMTGTSQSTAVATGKLIREMLSQP